MPWLVLLWPVACDPVSVRLGHDAGARRTVLCAPALFIAGVGKCGTNALSEHLARHPRIVANNKEVAWDPRETAPQKLVREKRVRANETRVWLVKHPKYSMQDSHGGVAGLAARLRAAYPTARVALTLCDPARLPWRRFLFALTSALTRDGTGAGRPETLRSLAATLSSPPLSSSLGELFALTFNPQQGCARSAAAERTLASLAASGFSLLYNNTWLRPGPAGAAHCAREWRLASTYAEQVAAWVRGLGALNRSVGVVYMEGWASRGEEFVRTFLSMLQLEHAEYPWHKARWAEPVFANNAAKGLAAELLHRPASASPAAEASASADGTLGPQLSQCVRQCAQLLQVTGMPPPWCAESAAAEPRRASSVAREREACALGSSHQK